MRRTMGFAAVLCAAGAMHGNASAGSYTFVATVQDVREPGVGADTFRILITGPNGFQYDSLDATGLATLTEGNVQVRKRA